MTIWSQWISEHVASFPRLVRDHHFGAVVTSVHLEYLRRFEFFDSDSLRIEGRVSCVRRRSLLRVDVRIMGVGGDVDGGEVVLMRSYLRPLRLAEGHMMEAKPAHVPEAIAAHFEPNEIDDATPVARPAQSHMARVAQEVPVITNATSVFCSRAMCEVADQWSFVELPAYASLARERVVLERGHEAPRIRDGLALPVSTIDVEYRRPSFAFDDLEVTTNVYDGPQLTFTHVVSGSNESKPRAVIVERF